MKILRLSVLIASIILMVSSGFSLLGESQESACLYLLAGIILLIAALIMRIK